MGTTSSTPVDTSPNNTSFYTYNGPTNSSCDIAANRLRYSKQCNDWPGGWIATQDLADNYCNKTSNKPSGATAKVFGAQIWAEWDDGGSQNCAYWDNKFVYNESASSSCDIVNNRTNYSQDCNNWPGGWVASQDIVNLCQRNKPANSNVGINGIKVSATWNDGGANNCAYQNNQFTYGPVQSECVLTGANAGKTRKYANCNNWPGGWIASQDVVNLCKKNAPAGSEVKISGVGVIAEWFDSSSNCIQDNYFNYPNPTEKNECVDQNTRRYSKQCNNWPAGWIASQDIVNYCNSDSSKPAGSTAAIYGTQVWASWTQPDPTCDTTTFEAAKSICDSKGSKMTFQKCSNWANNNASSCNTSSKKPTGVIGWIPCAIGSDPTTTMCSPYSTSFNCVWGQDCYAVTEYAQFPNNGSCDTTNYEASKDICDSKAGAMTYQKCTNWFANDPNSCNLSKKKPVV
jgi:hypothetical protein